MKKIILATTAAFGALASIALLVTKVALAGVSCSLPFNLQNNTVADATQVMANYNALVTCLGNAAAAGANNDITSLTALSTPITVAQGGTPVYVGGTSTGSANVQVVGSVSPATFSLTAGKQVTFTAGFSNTGPTTINVASTGATNIFRRTQLGVSAMVGGEIVAGQSVTVIYDGTRFQITSSPPALVGEIRDWTGITVPAGWVYIDGSCQTRVGVFADLFSVIGTQFDPTGSTCNVAQFALPDGRGRLLAGRDNMNTAANRITVAGSGCNGTTLGLGCGLENHTIITAELAAHTHGVVGTTGTESATHTHAVSGTTDNGGVAHTHGYTLTNDQNQAVQSGAGISVNKGTSGSNTLDASAINHTHAYSTTSGTESALHTHAMNFASGSAGSGTAMPILNPVQIVNKIVKY